MFTSSSTNAGPSAPRCSSSNEQQLCADDIVEITKRMKNTLNELFNTDNSMGFPSASKLNMDKDPSIAKIKGLTPIIEISHGDAFPGLMMARNRYCQHLMKEENITSEEIVKDDDLHLSKLTRAHYKNIEAISKSKSEEIGSQLHALYDLLTATKQINKPQGKDIIQFAMDMIAQVPDKEPLSVEDDLTEEQCYELIAQKLQNALEGNDLEDDVDEVRDGIEAMVMQKMGELLLLTQRNVSAAARVSLIGDMEEALLNLEESCLTILENASERIYKHALIHKQVGIQNFEEAAYHQMSKEMADHLLLNNGVLNFGIVDKVKDVLIPAEWKNFKAIGTLNMILNDIISDPMIWEVLASIGVPDSPKNPSCHAIRDCLNLSPKEPITKRDAQKFVLSALLGHYRQAKVGSCFATACLIKALHHHLLMYIHDLKRMTEKGSIERVVLGELRSFPYHARLGKEFLDTMIEVDGFGRVNYTMGYDIKPYQLDQWNQPNGTHIYQSPGLIAVCRALQITDAKETIIDCINELPGRFAVDDLLKKLVSIAFQRQESFSHNLRSREKLSLDQMMDCAEFAFGAQTSHPLHLAYDQVAASMVCYFNTQYIMPAHIFRNLEEILLRSLKGKGYDREHQAKARKVIREMFLPLITRMGFRYNPHIKHFITLFDDENYGRNSNAFYGYEAIDKGLPSDFAYSTDLYRQYKQETSHITFQRFEGYSPENSWKLINTEEKFREFLIDVINETVRHLITTSKASEKKTWLAVEKMMSSAITPSFCTDMVYNILGRESKQDKEWSKNPYTIQTTPWMFRWGGDFNEVMKSYFHLTHSPSSFKEHNGTAKDLLAACINYVKKQPELIREDLDKEKSMILISSPVHAFLLTPNEESFQEAWKSEVSTNEFIAKTVEAPGIAISELKPALKLKKQLISFVVNNMWLTNAMEKDDFERLQLTATSKIEFDRLLSLQPSLLDQTFKTFLNGLLAIVAKSRAADPKIRVRNTQWERQFATRLRHFIKANFSGNPLENPVSEGVAQQIIAFVRNHQDTVYLSENAVDLFLQNVEDMPDSVSLKQFRDLVVDAAYRAYKEDTYLENMDWKSSLCEGFDTYLFKILPQIYKNRLLESAVVTHDPNWKHGIHDMRTMFMVNPCTAKIEFCRYCPDTNEVEFFEQRDWFPRSENDHGYWRFPSNYLVYATQPLFNGKNQD